MSPRSRVRTGHTATSPTSSRSGRRTPIAAAACAPGSPCHRSPPQARPSRPSPPLTGHARPLRPPADGTVLRHAASRRDPVGTERPRVVRAIGRNSGGVPLDASASIRNVFTAWDADPANPQRMNDVTQGDQRGRRLAEDHRQQQPRQREHRDRRRRLRYNPPRRYPRTGTADGNEQGFTGDTPSVG